MDVFLTKLVELFRNPPVFFALIACVGLIIQKKKVSDIIKGSFKAMLGVIVLTEGVNIISASLTPLSNAISSTFATDLSGQTLGDYSAFIVEMGTSIGLVMVFGFLVNLLIARFTRFKAVFLTGHMMFFYSMLWVAVGVESGITGTALIVFGVLCYAISTCILPHLLTKEVENLTGSRTFTIGHSTTLFCLMGSWVGRLIGKKEQNVEDIKLPSSLDFLRDTTLTSGFVMIIVYAVVAFMVTPEVRNEVYGSSILSFVLLQGMTFSAGMVVLLQGARLMMAEILPAFKGIADKFVPGAVPALDVPMVFPYGQNSLMIGFVITLVVSLITMFVLNSMNFCAFPLLPATTACYFDVAPGAIFANKRGGLIAVIVWSILGGILMMVLCGLAIPILADTAGTFIQQMGANEESFWLLIFGPLGNLFGSIF